MKYEQTIGFSEIDLICKTSGEYYILNLLIVLLCQRFSNLSVQFTRLSFHVLINQNQSLFLKVNFFSVVSIHPRGHRLSLNVPTMNIHGDYT